MRTSFVAEIGSNHNGELHVAHALVDAAAGCGCDAVKFQYFKAEALFAPGFTARVQPERQVPLDWLPLLAAHAHARGLQFGVSVFDRAGAVEAAEHCDFLKVASYSVLDIELLRTVRRLGTPVILATGMATPDEIADALRAVCGHLLGAPSVTLLHCVSGYPAPADQANLRAIETLRRSFTKVTGVGWSDHTASPAVVTRAVVRWEAVVVECHLDLDVPVGAEGLHCWLPSGLAPVIAATRGDASAMDGSGTKAPQTCELYEVQWRADPADGLRPMRARREALLSPAV